VKVKMEIKKVKIEEIKYAPYNPRKISDEMLQKLEKSIKEFGYIEPLVVNKRTLHVVGGNQRLKVLKKLGIKEVQVVMVDLDDEHEKALNLALNKIQGEWDLPQLKELLQELEPNLELTGFDPKEFEALINQFTLPVDEPQFDEEIADDVKMVECPNCGFKFPI